MTLHPVELSREPGHLLIKWSDGELRRYRLKALQDACPCANCREKRSAPPPDPFVLNVVAGPQEAAPLEIVKMAPIGRYAYSIKFNHGCTRGIYSFETLRSLGERVEQAS